MHMIPSVPKDVKCQIEREKFIAQKALWQVRVVKETGVHDVLLRKRRVDNPRLGAIMREGALNVEPDDEMDKETELLLDKKNFDYV